MKITSELGGTFWDYAIDRPGAPAIIEHGGETRTFGELEDWSSRMAAALLDHGVLPGHVVAVLSENRWQVYGIQLAALQSGFRALIVNSSLSLPEVEYILQDSQASVVFASERWFTQLSDAPDLGLAAGVLNLIQMEPVVAGVVALRRARSEERNAGQTIMYTSGTTGHPRAVIRELAKVSPEDGVRASVAEWRSRYGIKPGHGEHLVTGPLYHGGPNRHGLNALHSGHTLVLMKKWDTELCLRLLHDYPITSTHMVPTMFHRLIGLPDEFKRAFRPSAVRSVIHGGAPIGIDLKKQMIDWWGPVFYEYYAGTESAVSSASSAEWLQKPGTVGRPNFGAELRILDDAGSELGPNEVGRIFIRSKESGFSYLNDSRKTVEGRVGDLFTLGDIGYLDRDGYLFLADRRTDVVISGGVNIYPTEVESVILAHPAVRDVAVVGEPHADWGQAVLALIELKYDIEQARLESELRALMDERLARFKHPKRFQIVPSVERNELGKIKRHELRRNYVETTQRTGA